jgi:aldehyde dehydrogenase (NAD+)
VLTSVAAGTAADIEIAVQAAKKAYKERWGLKVPGTERGKMLNKLADLIEANLEEFAALEALDVGRVMLQSYVLFVLRPLCRQGLQYGSDT